MNEDKLKKFIDQHREEFETERPHRMVWQNIEHQLRNSGRTRSLWNIIPMIYKIAASGLILISLGVGIGFKVQQQKDLPMPFKTRIREKNSVKRKPIIRVRSIIN